MTATFSIAAARTAADLDAARRLFADYVASLDLDLSFQGIEAELATLPGAYAPPGGVLLLARGADGAALGCVAMRPLPEGRCEMKRLHVAPEGRGLGIGRALVEAVIGEARRIGHREMRLDSLPFMADAIALYRWAGFEPIAPYYDTPIAGTVFLGRPLDG